MSQQDDSRPLVAQVTASYPPRVCGIADYTSHLVDALRAGGARTEVWTREGETEARPSSVRPVVPRWDASGVRVLASDLTAARPHVVHLQYERAIYDQEPAISLLLPGLLRRAGIPLVTTFHALDGPRGWGKAHRLALLPLLLGSRDVIVCSHRQLHAVQKLPGVGRRAALVPIGNVIPVMHERRQGGRAPGEPLRLLYFGFIWRGRNIETLLRSLQAVIAAGTEATLEVIGGVKDPAYLAELTLLAGSLGVGERVRFRGALPSFSVSEALADADAVLLPFETGVSTGRTTLMAALAHHAPVVTMGAADNLSPLFADGENLCITPVGDEAAFVAATREVAQDVALRERLSNGAARLAEAFSWPSIARQVLALPSYHGVVPSNLPEPLTAAIK